MNLGQSANHHKTAKIIVVEDEAIVGTSTCDTLDKLGYNVLGLCMSGSECLSMAASERPDLVLMDISIAGDITGIETASRLITQDIAVVYATAHSDTATFNQAKQTNAYGFVVKPLNDRDLQISIEIALEIKKMERSLKASHRLIDTILRGLSDAVAVTDHEERITFFNRAAERLTGWSEREALGRPLQQLLVTYDPTCLVSSGNLVSLSEHGPLGVHQDQQYVLVAKDGSRVPITQTAAPLDNDEGPSSGWVLVFRDISKEVAQKAEHEGLITDLRNALGQLKTLSGLLPICAWCRKIRDDDNHWKNLEAYVHDHFDTDVTHGICPECSKKQVAQSRKCQAVSQAAT